MREIKPDEINHCAECGSEAVMYYNGAEFMIWCTKCKNTVYSLTQEKALLDWNALNPKTKIPSKQPPEIPVEKSEELPKLKPCPFCGSMPVEYNGCIRCEAPDCYVQPGVKSEMPEFLPKLWNQMAMIESEDEKPESQNETINIGPFKPCAKCGSPVEWEISFSRGDAGFVKCPRCGNGITFNNGDFSGIDEIVEKWNQVNKPEENPEQSDNTERIFPDENSLMLKIKLSLLNSILGLQRDAVGPVIEVKEIQETLVEIVKAIHDGVKWDNSEPIKKLAGETEKMKKDPYLIPSEKKNIPIRGSVYVTELHIARAVCQEAEMLVWKYEQKNGIEGMTAIPEYLYQLSEWLFVRAEYLRETEEYC